ncbi:M23 family metallopeptidase [Leifsonia sp. NPDC102414]|uniref:M23 family metallopeptidase n=1 Tax=Leifsonia sp. NPDC102414 TaxID=3364124 RepID=UPI003800F5F0
MPVHPLPRDDPVKAVAAVLAGVLGLPLSLILALTLAGSTSASALCGGGAGTVNVAAIPATATVGGYNAGQLANAGHIMNAAAALKLSVKAEQLGVMTAMGESSLNNIGHGDNALNPEGSVADSIGLFQQQSSWGSTTDRMDPEISATLFFKRLVTVPGWESMEPSLAAHTVQVNADPNHYTRWWQDAVDATNELAQKYAAAGPTTCTSEQAAYPLNTPYVMTDDFGPRPAPGDGGSTWHKGDDFVGQCGDPIYAVLPGAVVESSSYTLGVQSPDGFTVLYLHSYPQDRLVHVGDQITRGEQIAKVGSAGPSTGCHLHLGINITGNKNPQVAALPTDPNAPGYVDPETFMDLLGITLCPADWCTRDY